MSKKKILISGLIGLTVIILIFVGYHVILHLIATARMKELSQQLEQKISAWEKKSYRRPPLYGEPIPGNAAVFYQKAIDKLEDPEEIWIQLSNAIGYPTQSLSPTVLAYCKRNKPIIELIQKATQTEVYKPLINIKDGIMDIKIPDLITAQNISKIMILQGRELAQNNQVLEAIKSYCNILRMGDDYMRSEPIISAMIGVAVSEIGQRETQRLLLNKQLSEQHLAKLLGYLKILLDAEPSFQDVWETEGLCLEVWLKQKAELTSIIPMPQEDFNGRWINRSDCVNAWEDIVIFWPRLKKIQSLPFIQAQAESEKFTDRIKTLKNPFSRMIFPNVLTCNISYLESRAFLRGTYILTALKLYQAKHQKYPDKLADLALSIIPEVPSDPFTDKPFIYRVDKDKKLFLYSVGYNLIDDGCDEQSHKDIVIAPAK